MKAVVARFGLPVSFFLVAFFYKRTKNIRLGYNY